MIFVIPLLLCNLVKDKYNKYQYLICHAVNLQVRIKKK